jgi:hypothetical protein
VAAKTATAPAVEIPNNPLKEAYFGEQHLHTRYSLDAFLGGEALTPDGAYKFAQGAEVQVSGVTFKIDQPLDWAAVTDHAEYLGEMFSTLNEGVLGSDNPQVIELRGLTDYTLREEWFQKYVIAPIAVAASRHTAVLGRSETSKSGWKKILKTGTTASRANSPRSAYEWAAHHERSLHHNVFFRDIDHVPRGHGFAELNHETELWSISELEAQGLPPWPSRTIQRQQRHDG